jgi:uncharacterized protein
MSKNNYEIRSASEFTVEDRTIKGYASVFNTESNTLYAGGTQFREVILPTAFDGLLGQSDVVALYNHMESTGVLARSKNGTGTLKLSVDDRGLYFEFEAPNTPLGESVLEGIRRQDLDGCSFAFIVQQGGEKWTRQADGTYLREISKIGKLLDISIVVRQAYQEATISTRGLELAEEEELELYYNNLKEQLK